MYRSATVAGSGDFISITMARSTKQEAIETRDRILDAAQTVFHARGVSRTSLADVAHAAHVTRGAIYWHFANKADLFNAMCERVRLPMEAMVDETRGPADEAPLQQLRSACLFAIGQIVREPRTRQVFDILHHKCEFVDVDDAIWHRQHESFVKGMRNIERLLMLARDAGQLSADLDIHLAAVSLHAMLDGLINNWLFSPQSFALGAELERLLDACFEMIHSAPSLRLR